ncbi:14279_t:CDS:10 [Racocetra fulgida]|uniref:14279_t:CDS:1 n=1 Tax=Racocetra fulgida TaxID=60492 RepID=A0A9N9AY63_9GLOM|nr:14279_t:CDS:10 [Racocetra fulgida]
MIEPNSLGLISLETNLATTDIDEENRIIKIGQAEIKEKRGASQENPNSGGSQALKLLHKLVPEFTKTHPSTSTDFFLAEHLTDPQLIEQKIKEGQEGKIVYTDFWMFAKKKGCVNPYLDYCQELKLQDKKKGKKLANVLYGVLGRNQRIGYVFHPFHLAVNHLAILKTYYLYRQFKPEDVLAIRSDCIYVKGELPDKLLIERKKYHISQFQKITLANQDTLFIHDTQELKTFSNSASHRQDCPQNNPQAKGLEREEIKEAIKDNEKKQKELKDEIKEIEKERKEILTSSDEDKADKAKEKLEQKEEKMKELQEIETTLNDLKILPNKISWNNGALLGAGAAFLGGFFTGGMTWSLIPVALAGGAAALNEKIAKLEEQRNQILKKLETETDPTEKAKLIAFQQEGNKPYLGSFKNWGIIALFVLIGIILVVFIKKLFKKFLGMEDFRNIVNVSEARRSCKGHEVRHGSAEEGHSSCGSCAGNYYSGGECNYGGRHRLTDDLNQINQNFQGFEVLVSRHARLKKVKDEGEFDREKKELITAFENMKSRCENAQGFFYGSCIGLDGTQAKFNSAVNARFQQFARELGGFIDKVKKIGFQQFAEFKMKLEKLENMKAEAAKLGEQIKNEKDPAKKKQLMAALATLKDNMGSLQKELQKHPCKDLFDKDVGDFLNNILQGIITGNTPGGGRKQPFTGRFPTGGNKSVPDDNSQPDEQTKKGLFSLSPTTKESLKKVALEETYTLHPSAKNKYSPQKEQELLTTLTQLIESIDNSPYHSSSNTYSSPSEQDEEYHSLPDLDLYQEGKLIT